MHKGVPVLDRIRSVALALLWLLAALPMKAEAEKRPAPAWPPEEGVPLTEWGRKLDEQNVLPEYPRPQMVRAAWLNLNGLWDYAITPKQADRAEHFDGRILVPFAPQSVLSKVNKAVSPQDKIWYRRRFEIPADWSGQRVLLHLGAANWQAQVWVNGQDVGGHSGGYDPFTLEITDALRASGSQELTVSAWNPIEAGQPSGKQTVKPGGIFYTPVSGLWQTLWLEPVPKASIARLKMTPDVDDGTLHVVVEGRGADGKAVELTAKGSGRVVACATGVVGQAAVLRIPHAHLWWPEDPFLYDLEVKLKDGGSEIDRVDSYFGMRKISVGKDGQGIVRILLNNTFVLQNGLLDQGYWPDGIYTAPSDEALRFDIEVARRLGFNMLRKHIKVEPARWYYWADKLGMLVWQDMPATRRLMWEDKKKELIENREDQFEHELRRMVDGLCNHPSIVVWVVFNEGWGLLMKQKEATEEQDAPDPRSGEIQQRMVKAVRQLDATRLVDAESGTGGGSNGNPENFWDVGEGDLIDYHCYGGKTPPDPDPEGRRAVVIGEYGFASSMGSAHKGLTMATNSTASAIVLTQVSDVETEVNGALNYDRTPKPKTPIDQTGADVLAWVRSCGYSNYPGRGTK